MRFLPFFIFLAMMFLVGCEGWKLDYGKPVAQFLEKDLSAMGKAYLGKKITVKGKVSKVLIHPVQAKVFLESGIECNLGKFTRMAENCKVGDEIFVDGILKSLEKGEALLDPAVLRDPNADFVPLRE
ncbi:MAG: hypothetical protein VX588_04380 [Verrucomicrobiota bacterium]|nr:hypothetical protein [Verrucomicrobiota bacterium]MED5470524.1 hypothetical protein [Verrucomicrobiota bacterium]